MASAWSAISGPCTIWLLVRMMSSRSRRSLPPDLNRTPSAPALMIWTHFKFLPARTCAGVIEPIKASASPISFITLSLLTAMTCAFGEALRYSFRSGPAPMTRIFLFWAERAQAKTASNPVKRRIIDISFKERIVSRDVRALRFHVYRIERLAGAHEESVAFGPAKADIGAHLRQENHANSLAGGREDMYAVVSGADPTRADPDITVDVGADTVGLACAFPGHLH